MAVFKNYFKYSNYSLSLPSPVGEGGPNASLVDEVFLSKTVLLTPHPSPIGATFSHRRRLGLYNNYALRITNYALRITNYALDKPQFIIVIL